MKFTKGKFTGVWFIWPSVIYYFKHGMEIRWLKWYIGAEWNNYSLKIEKIKAGGRK